MVDLVVFLHVGKDCQGPFAVAGSVRPGLGGVAVRLREDDDERKGLHVPADPGPQALVGLAGAVVSRFAAAVEEENQREPLLSGVAARDENLVLGAPVLQMDEAVLGLLVLVWLVLVGLVFLVLE